MTEKSNLRELIIEKIKQDIDWRNESFSYDGKYVPEKYPNFDKESDEALLDIYEKIPRGPIG